MHLSRPVFKPLAHLQKGAGFNLTHSFFLCSVQRHISPPETVVQLIPCFAPHAWGRHELRLDLKRIVNVFPRVIFITGGAASGKSLWAEDLVIKSGKSKAYLATSQMLDGEMQAKIDTHRARRGPDWSLSEAPLDLAPTLATLGRDQICLIDCATMWLSNHLLAKSDLAQAQAALLDAIATCTGDLVIVSNEVGQGIVPDNALARHFREAQGRLNIALAARADLVVQVIVGLPLVLKGQLP